MDYYGPMLRLHRLALLPLVALSLAVSAQQTPSVAVPEPEATSPMDDALLYQLLLAEINSNEGEPAAAYALFLDAARKANDAQLYHRAVEIALQSRAGDAALQAARAWKEAQPQSPQANRYVLQILIGLNRISETLEPLKTELAGIEPAQRSFALNTIARQFLRAADKKAAVEVVEKALRADLRTPQTMAAAWTVVARLRLNAGDLEGADEATKRVLELNQATEGAALLALELMAQNRAPGEPLMLAQLQGKNDPGIRMAYARLLLQAQRYTDAAGQIHAAIEQQPDFEAAWLMQGALQLEKQQYEEAEVSLKRYLSLVEGRSASLAGDERGLGTAQAYLYLADIATRRKDYAAAQGWLEHVDDAKEIVAVQTRRANILALQGKLAEARLIVQGLPGRNPDELRTRLLMEAQLLREAKQYHMAYELLRQATTEAATDPEVQYEQAMLAEKLGELGEMERLLRAVISTKPDYQAAYNALGYSLADRNLRLAEAKLLIQKALELAPGDPFISDSLGWVEFRVGNKDEAARILEAAYRARPDAEIAAHLGEVLWSLGQKERAVDFFKEATKLNSGNETLGETLKRLHVKW